MQRLCTKCHYIGKSNKADLSANATLVFVLLLAGAFLWLGFWHPIFILGTYFCAMALAVGIDKYYSHSIECPKCNEIGLIPLNSQKAQNIILINNLLVDDTQQSYWEFLSAYDSLKFMKRKICTNCYHTGISHMQNLCYMSWGLLLIVAGIITIPLASFHPLYLIINFLFLFMGLSGTIPCIMEPVRCPSCEEPTLIPINSPEAREIIKEQNIQDIGLVMDPVTESKLFTVHENLVFAFLIGSWIVVAIIMFLIYLYFSGLQ